ncbi:alpha-aspartyl dipeptidase-like isoform X2 [Ctenocephalides felis]|nr:alpha-aspartyl dipeptidase-like isoform X2 [Ctenocephalides felis]XP_026462121.1 alpha-aspartyl dipeptidase-like isoform X2 [Ctenocephalides felis]XP_026462122.1 alpha-aspartyl dipeptidase-like isoform X2 [Ctenocephalides felis]XP_026462123.1 alpha-aspartyl dipeptidase-like isoform X2 [Ctenocephalides felis]XP_026462124.1 alpha-aspartyl dipeptidase-like isoform X2 [Ctenocephalides felis]
MSRRRLLLLSSSSVHGHQYLVYARDEIIKLLKPCNVEKILFIPYAMKDHDAYTDTVAKALNTLNFEVEGIHTFSDPVKAVENAQAIFIGGGNTFQLLKTLYDKSLICPIRKRVHEDGMPYMGSSAGTNVATISINTTNDMPIVYPPTFKALELIPFNINPHYIDADPLSTHKGETREDRIGEYLEQPESHNVLGLREGCMLEVSENKAFLRGIKGARLFERNIPARELCVNDDVSFLLNSCS